MLNMQPKRTVETPPRPEDRDTSLHPATPGLCEQTLLALAAAGPIAAHHERSLWTLRAKRVGDLVLGSILLALLLPVLVVTAICIRLESPGTVLLFQPRHGFRGRVFSCLKLRSMYVNSARPEVAASVTGQLVKEYNDPRITRVGRFIRRTSIDELPQLWNVVRGDMSLVGPRPLVLHMLDPYPEILAVRSLARPGITGLWQVNDRANCTHLFFMLPYDLEYLRTMSIWTDLRILARTVGVAISGAGAI